MGKRFGVEVLDVGERAIRVSFPFADWPSDGTAVELELPSDHEYVRYRATVAYEPETTYVAGLVLHDLVRCEPEKAQRVDSRVPTDLTVQVRETPHPRRFNASVVNLSVGGALLRSDLGAAPGHELDIDMSLPCHCVERLPARVVHVAPDGESFEGQLLGVQFVNTRPETRSAISDYIEHQLEAIG
jgi:hypothetical protein